MDIVMKSCIILIEIILIGMAFGVYIPRLIKNFKRYTISKKVSEIFFIVIIFLVVLFGIGIWNLCF